MDIDLSIVRNLPKDEAFFRLYRWQPYCISLGANQNANEINFEKTRRDNIDVVKRPTGGRSILHAEEWTYSVAIPLTINLTPRQIYTKISAALINGLIKFAPILKQQLELENLQPNFPELLKQPSGTLCFASTAKSEVKYNGKKLIGSAQRKLGSSILQHGSILIGQYHKKLPEYININKNIRENLKKIMTDKTTELETILGKKVDYRELEKYIILGFEEEWNIQFVNNQKRAIDYCSFAAL